MSSVLLCLILPSKILGVNRQKELDPYPSIAIIGAEEDRMDRMISSLVRRYVGEPTDENAHKVAQAVTRSVGSGGDVRKVVVTSGYGGGWSSGARSVRQGVLMAEYAPLVEAVEALGEGETLTWEHPAVASLIVEMRLLLQKEDRDPQELPYPLSTVDYGNGDGHFPALEVVEVVGPYVISEYDGSESVRVPSDYQWR
jgi:hypothetical protein